ncbi:hypothetical protein GCM10011362_20320 [Marinobacter halophilus]|nr:hypothetical protein GCM10011362_20320 [Marinobacter halophilus]
MVAMMRCPPKGPTLSCAGAEDGKHELRFTTGLECLVREVPVIEAGNSKHADDKKTNCEHHGKCADTGEKSEQASKVKSDERQHPHHVKRSGAGIQVI